MNIANYINDLLYRYDCVIVPNFGGFITNRVGAKLNVDSHTFTPPKKLISFNSHLKGNDGLLANFISSSENITFEEAATLISEAVVKWNEDLKQGVLNFGAIGTLMLNENKKVIFEPNTSVNFLAESFGLSAIHTHSVQRTNTLNKVAILKEEKPVIPIHKNEDRKGVATFIKYAATAAILLTLGFVGNNAFKQNKQQTQIANQKNALEKKIQSATFVISNPLPTLELNITKEEVVKKEVIKTNKFAVIAGAFQFKENAEKKVKQLKKQGFNAVIVGVNKWGLTQVAFDTYSNRNDALDNLYRIQKNVSRDAWLLSEK